MPPHGLLLENMTSSTKPEVQNVIQRRQSKTVHDRHTDRPIANTVPTQHRVGKKQGKYLTTFPQAKPNT